MQVPELPVGKAVEVTVDWLRDNLAFVFDTIHAVVGLLITNVEGLLNAPPWWVVVALATALAFWARGWQFAAFTAAGLLVVDGMRLWPETMDTIALAVVATALAALIGVPIGILAAKSDVVSHIVRPILDFMQTLPVFVYLIPAIFFFGIGVVPAVVATVIFAMAPAVRLTELGIRQVDAEMVEASVAFGARPSQLLRDVQLPLSMPSIMAGVNQAIMMSLSMAVIAGMVGAGGLGAVVLRGISQLDIGIGFEGGIAVVFIAIFLDRLTSSFQSSRPARRRSKRTAAPAGVDEGAGNETRSAASDASAAPSTESSRTSAPESREPVPAPGDARSGRHHRATA